ncbi:hypothetical protein C8Q74DRAFT_373981 [Fomes fomentarius]|nr:hypothetical protein C8Q74DRAFT_373981 [Fomes fomentarius]
MKGIRILSFLLLSVVVVLTTPTKRDSYYVEVQDDTLQAPSYAWIIGEDEGRRIGELLDHDMGDLDFLGFNMNTPPLVCPHCGKETEVIDWVWTALNRGIHSKEWLVQSLKEGKLSKKNAHDVYCSRCGHLTAFRDPSGDEGGMHHISHATPYDPATRTFGKRDADAAAGKVPVDTARLQPEVSEGTDNSDSAPQAAWHPIWLVKKDNAPSDVLANHSNPNGMAAQANASHSDPLPAWRPIWLIKETALDAAEAKESDTAVYSSSGVEAQPYRLAKKDNAPAAVKDTVGDA